jgi:hypothetical protein
VSRPPLSIQAAEAIALGHAKVGAWRPGSVYEIRVVVRQRKKAHSLELLLSPRITRRRDLRGP